MYSSNVKVSLKKIYNSSPIHLGLQIRFTEIIDFPFFLVSFEIKYNTLLAHEVTAPIFARARGYFWCRHSSNGPGCYNYI